ncbi:hypothetical protein [uncultured Intestinimonas sp.]|uniref:hypothetical protein n=1 Tax=uncultured Intestinimonas sp. TaxID=1689265 RepID=UPI0025DC00C2|nr:hypothetical protein [uncultured Intestinimonas sp.]
MATSQKAVNQYRQKNYYTFSVSVPARYKETIKAAAAERGVSVSRLVCDLLGRELGLDLADLALDGVFPGAKKAEEP